jgi:hypothetical protein
VYTLTCRLFFRLGNPGAAFQNIEEDTAKGIRFAASGNEGERWVLKNVPTLL